MKSAIVLFTLIFSSYAEAGTVQEITTSLWLRPATAALDGICKYSVKPCETKHYSIDLKNLEKTPENVFFDYLDVSIEHVRLLPLSPSEVKAHLLGLMKLAQVKQDANHKAAFQEFLRLIQAPETGFELEAFEGLSLNEGSELSNLYIMVKSSRYQYAEILELFVERFEL